VPENPIINDTAVDITRTFSSLSISKTPSNRGSTMVLEAPSSSSPFKELSILDRLLTPFVFIAMVVGVVIGEFAPSVQRTLNTAKFHGVSIRAQFPPFDGNDW